MTPRSLSRLVSSDVRVHNLGLVLLHLDRHGPSARTEIAEATGLVPGAITPIVAELQASGLVRAAAVPDEGAGSTAVRRGRPRETLELDGTAFALLGFHLGVGEILIEAVDLAGRRILHEVHEVRIPFGDPPAVADLLRSLLTPALHSVSRAGAATVQLQAVVSAPVTNGSSVVPVAVDLGWLDVDFGALLRERLPEFPLGIAVVNDADMSAYAEYVALRGHPETADLRHLTYLKSNTGIGGGAIVDGQLLLGKSGLAFEPGHLIVDPDGRPCLCGRTGCLVTVAGPEVVLHEAGLDAFTEEFGMPAALTELLRRRADGDAAADSAIVQAARWFRLALGNIAMLFEPEVMVVGGYLADLVADLRELPDVATSALGTGPLHGSDAILPSVRGRFSPVEGALALARNSLLEKPSLLPTAEKNRPLVNLTLE